MNNTDKNENSLEQKICTALIGAVIVVLAVVTVIYGVQTRKNADFAKEKIQSGEQNPVAGPIAKSDTKDKKSDLTEKEESSEKIRKEQQPKQEVLETMAAVQPYNGTDKFAWPVSGNVIIPYSMDTTVYFETLDQYQCNPALYIKAEAGTEVKAVLGGTVSSVVDNRRYGKMITVDMGNGYKMTYGQLEDITFQKGDVVQAGNVIGKIAGPTDYFALEGSHLYMKMTQQGKAVNPTEYMEP